MTYFLDYFLQLMAHAAEEHKLKTEEQNSKTMSAERQMAGTVLAPSDTAPDPIEEEIPEIDISEFTFLSSGDPYSDESLDAYEKADNLEKAAGRDTGQRNEGEWVGESRFKAKLEEVLTSRSKDYQGLLLQYLKSGKYTFASRDMYNSFGNDFFSTKMLVATLSYTENVAKAVLHSFRLLRILDCHKDGVNMYQFRVNPEDNPECFEPAA